jgi:SAM-dependent methyltransferase
MTSRAAAWAGGMRRLVADDTWLRRGLTARRWMSRLYFEARYLVPDPWRLATSPYERARAEDSIAALGNRCYAVALELGCGEGVFTGRLLARCGRVVAVDFSALATARARRRFAGEARVDVRQMDLCTADLPGTFDLVFCAELFYYLTPAEAETLAARMLRWAAPGGDLCLVHGTSCHDAEDGGATRPGASGAAAIHRRFLGRPGFVCVDERCRPGYRITLLRREAHPPRPGAGGRLRSAAWKEQPRAVRKDAEEHGLREADASARAERGR